MGVKDTVVRADGVREPTITVARADGVREPTITVRPVSDAGKILLALVALMWAVEVVDVIADHQLDQYGIEAREADGLDGNRYRAVPARRLRAPALEHHSIR